jgi:fructose-1,6-bisphosphatase/inositol monophosphatase family enzyme
VQDSKIYFGREAGRLHKSKRRWCADKKTSWAWDVAAGWTILNEAGGMMVSGNPGDWEPTIDSRKYLAVRAAPRGQREIIEEFWEVIGDGRLEYSS